MICLTPKLSQSFLVNHIKSKGKFFIEKEFFKEKREWRIEKKTEDFLTTLATVIKKNSTTSIRKHANELKIHKKTVRIAKTRFEPRP